MTANNTPKIHFINAGAGSGKTTRLVSLFCEHLLGKEVSLDSKMIVPYTQREVIPAERIMLTTYTRAAAGEFKDRIKSILLKNRRADLVSSVDSATIGTIDSICQQYIQKYWYLLDMTPNLVVKEKKDFNIILRQLLDKETIATKSDKYILSLYRGQFELKKKDDEERSVDYVDFWKDAAIDILCKMEMYDIPSTRLKEIRDTSLDTVKTIFSKNSTATQEFDLSQYEKDLVECINLIFNIVERLLKEYNAYKVSNNLLTYQDLEVKFLKLLDFSQVREDLVNSLSCLMVDEFQDISPIQLKIYQKLSSILSQTYWVGDPKQSIYGFRGSDVQLVNGVIHNLPSVPSDTQLVEGQILTSSEQLINGKLCKTENLSTSYRSLPVLVDKVSDIFTHAFSTSVLGANSKEVLTPEQVKLIPCNTKMKPLQDQLSKVCDGKFIHHLWQTNHVKSGESSDARRYDVMYPPLAEYIKSAVADSSHPLHQVADREINALRDITYGDIAILTKSNDRCEKIGITLSEHGIPVSISQTKIIDQIEVRLALAFLKYIYGTEEKLSIAEINKLWEDMSLDENLGSLAAGAAPNQIFDKLDKFRSEYQYNSIYHTLREIISYFDLYNYVAKWGLAEVRKNNLKSLLQYADQYSQSNNTSISDFIKYIKSTEIKSDFDNSGNSVKILTYHKAKGLEWKVVILDDLYFDWEKKFQGIVGVKTMSDENGNTIINYFPPVDNISKKVLANCKSTNLSLYKDCYSKSLAEQIRLLYVGFTRAENHIVIPSFGAAELKLLSCLGITVDQLVPLRESFPSVGTQTESSSVSQVCSLTPGTIKEASCRRLSPSTAGKEPSSNSLSVSEVISLTSHIDISQLPLEIAETDKGTCIHNFMAAYRWNGSSNVAKNREWNLKVANRILENFSMASAIKAEELVDTASVIFTELETKYGTEITLEREVSIKHYLDDSRIVDGEIDLLIGLGEKDSKKQYVIVDYKNVSKEPEDIEKHTSGYFSQLSYYKNAVLAGEGNSVVTEMYICYPTLGKLILIK